MTDMYAWETRPRPVYVIQWDGDNWDEMRKFLRRHAPGWTVTSYTTNDRSILIERHSGGSDFVLEPDEWLIKFSWDNDGTTSWDIGTDYARRPA